MRNIVLEDYSKNINFSVELAEMVVEAEIFPSVLTCLKVDNQLLVKILIGY